MNQFMKLLKGELPIKVLSKTTYLMGREYAFLKRDKSTSGSLLMEKQKPIMDIMYFLMAPYIKGTSRIPCLMVMAPSNMKLINYSIQVIGEMESLKAMEKKNTLMEPNTKDALKMGNGKVKVNTHGLME